MHRPHGNLTAKDHRSLSSTSSDCVEAPSLVSSPAAIVDSKKDPSVKSRKAHLRLTSFSRLRSRASFTSNSPKSPSSPDTGSHKRSDTSTLSYKSSEATLSDDAKPDSSPTKEGSSFLLSSENIPADLKASKEDVDASKARQGLARARPHTMHQTSSKLLRMTDDERPFTRVRTCSTPSQPQCIFPSPRARMFCIVAIRDAINSEGPFSIAAVRA